MIILVVAKATEAHHLVDAVHEVFPDAEMRLANALDEAKALLAAGEVTHCATTLALPVSKGTEVNSLIGGFVEKACGEAGVPCVIVQPGTHRLNLKVLRG